MAVPSSGQLRLRADIALEVDGSATGSNVSLRTLSASANFSTPDNMSEFYGYSAASPATLSAASASGVTNSQIIANCNVTSDGGSTITERGFYFGTSTNMTSNPKYVVAGTTGGFSLTRTGLSASTTYRFWAYATNAAGTVYSARVDAATYSTMTYSTATLNNQDVYSDVYLYPSSGYVSGVNEEYLMHPYLGNVSLYYASSNHSSYGSRIWKTSRIYANKTSDWGSNLARTRWQSYANVPWDNYQSQPTETHIAYIRFNGYPDIYGPPGNWAALPVSDAFVGGYRWRYNYTGSQHKNLYTQNSTYIWNFGSYMDVFR